MYKVVQNLDYNLTDWERKELANQEDAQRKIEQLRQLQKERYGKS